MLRENATKHIATVIKDLESEMPVDTLRPGSWATGSKT